MKLIGFGDIHGPEPYKFIGFGAMDGTKPYKFIGFGAGQTSKTHGILGLPGARVYPGGYAFTLARGGCPSMAVTKAL